MAIMYFHIMCFQFEWVKQDFFQSLEKFPPHFYSAYKNAIKTTGTSSLFFHPNHKASKAYFAVTSVF